MLKDIMGCSASDAIGALIVLGVPLLAWVVLA